MKLPEFMLQRTGIILQDVYNTFTIHRSGRHERILCKDEIVDVLARVPINNKYKIRDIQGNLYRVNPELIRRNES